jgi:hypothetical protein
MSPITGAERVLFRDPYLNATGNLRDAEAVEMVADAALTGGLRGPAKMLLGKKSMEQLAAEPWRRMTMPPTAAGAGAGAAGVTFAPDEAEGAKLPGGEAAARAIQAAKNVIAPQRQLSPLGLYSHGAETAAGLQQAKGTPEQYKAMLMRQGVKPAEFEASGFDAAFAGRPTITRDEIAEHFSQSMPQIERTVLGYDPAKVRAAREMAESQGHVWDDLGLANQNRYIRQADGRGITEYGNDPKFQQYTLPGGTNYREVVLRYDPNKPPISENQYYELSDKAALGPLSEAEKEQMKAYTAWKNNDAKVAPPYKSTHYPDETGYLAHIRYSDRTGPNGEKMLLVDEGQSDYGQAVRKLGFSSPEEYDRWLKADNAARTALQRVISDHNRLTDSLAPRVNEPFIAGRESPRAYERRMADLEGQRADALHTNPEWIASADRLRQAFDARDALGPAPSTTGLPKAPFVGSTEDWTALIVKDALREAAEGGYDKIIWTPGAEQAKRYNLSHNVDEIAHWREGNQIGLSASGPNGTIFDQKIVTPEELPALVGQELAKKILNGEGSARSISGYPEETGVSFISGDGLNIGGEGQKGYYDKIFPKVLQSQAKRHDKSAKLGQEVIQTEDTPKTMAHFLDWAIDNGSSASRSSLGEMWRNGANDPLVQQFMKETSGLEVGGLPVTPQMRESIKRGQQLYRADGGSVVDRALMLLSKRGE